MFLCKVVPHRYHGLVQVILMLVDGKYMGPHQFCRKRS
jgi:hypothetical protein